MVTTIILALAALTAALVIGVFVVALMELDALDKIMDSSPSTQAARLLRTAPESKL